MAPTARTQFAWVCIATLLVCSRVSAPAQALEQQLGAPGAYTAAEHIHSSSNQGVQASITTSNAKSGASYREYSHKLSRGHAATLPAAAATAAGYAGMRSLLQAVIPTPQMQQLQQSVEEPVPPAVIDSHHPAPASAAAAGRGAKKTKMIVKGFLAHPEHKSLLPIDYKDVCLFILSSCVLSLAAGAGIGGGVLLVPMLSLITGFGNIQTVALSNITIFAGAITNMVFNLPRKNPFKPGPIIDYDLLLLFGPPIVMGSIAGSYINYFVPGWVTKTLVLLVLAPMTWRMIHKARMLWVAETRRVSCEQQQGGLHWSASELVGSSLELVGSVPEDKEVSGEMELARITSLQGSLALTAAEAASSIRKHQHQLQLTPLATVASVARLSGQQQQQQQQGATGSGAGVLSPQSAKSHAGAHRFLGHRPSSMPQDRDWNPHDSVGSHGSFAQASHVQRPTPSHSHANMLAALSDRPPSLADLLGPYFVVLTTPQVADATLQAQAISRQLTLQHSHSVTRRHTLDASQNSICLKQHSSTGSRPSSAPTVPSDPLWDPEHGPDANAAAAAGGGGGSVVGGSSPGGWYSCQQSVDGGDLLSIISPFQLYQQQRIQQGAEQQDKPCHSGCEGCAGHDPCHDNKPLPVAAGGKCRRLVHTCCVHTPELDAKMRQKIHHHATAQVPKAHCAALLLMLAAVTATSVLASLQLTCGTWEYWLVVLTPLPLMMIVWALMRWHVLWRVGWQNVLGMTHPTDIAWTATSTLTFPAIVITVGVMAGMLGLGGGIVLAPLLLELGVQPAVSAASSQAAMLMSSCTSTVVYLVNDALPHDYGIAMAIIGFTGTLFGQIAFNYAVQRTGRSSILVFILAVLFVLASAAAVVVISNSITAIVKTPAKLTMTYAHDICKMRGG